MYVCTYISVCISGNIEEFGLIVNVLSNLQLIIYAFYVVLNVNKIFNLVYVQRLVFVFFNYNANSTYYLP